MTVDELIQRLSEIRDKLPSAGKWNVIIEGCPIDDGSFGCNHFEKQLEIRPEYYENPIYNATAKLQEDIDHAMGEYNHVIYTTRERNRNKNGIY